jgi:hypothetical protein
LSTLEQRYRGRDQASNAPLSKGSAPPGKHAPHFSTLDSNPAGSTIVAQHPIRQQLQDMQNFNQQKETTLADFRSDKG